MKKYLINGKEVPRYYYSIIHAAECLFADYNGTGESISWQVQDEMVKFLEARISDWHESKPINKPYDDAVKNLVETVLWVIKSE